MRSEHPAVTNGVESEASHQSELARVLDAYIAAVEAGDAVDPETLAARHPAIADRLRACLSVLHVASQVEGRAVPMSPSRRPPTPIWATSASFE